MSNDILLGFYSVTCDCGTKYTRNSPVDEIGERYSQFQLPRLNHAVVFKLHHPYIQFPRNVRLSHRRIATLSRTVTEIFSVEFWRNLEIIVRGHWKSLEMAPFDRSDTSSSLSFIVTTAVSCIVFEIKRDVGREIVNFHTTLPFNLHHCLEPLGFFFSKIWHNLPKSLSY